DGDWATWGAWSGCDVTCESGTQVRIRTCTNPEPANGGVNCVGDSTQHKQCTKQLCPGMSATSVHMLSYALNLFFCKINRTVLYTRQCISIQKIKYEKMYQMMITKIVVQFVFMADGVDGQAGVLARLRVTSVCPREGGPVPTQNPAEQGTTVRICHSNSRYALQVHAQVITEGHCYTKSVQYNTFLPVP
ncbi:SEM5B-like protein, partial [Mya arenaria]